MRELGLKRNKSDGEQSLCQFNVLADDLIFVYRGNAMRPPTLLSGITYPA